MDNQTILVTGEEPQEGPHHMGHSLQLPGPTQISSLQAMPAATEDASETTASSFTGTVPSSPPRHFHGGPDVSSDYP